MPRWREPLGAIRLRAAPRVEVRRRSCSPGHQSIGSWAAEPNLQVHRRQGFGRICNSRLLRSHADGGHAVLTSAGGVAVGANRVTIIQAAKDAKRCGSKALAKVK